MRQQAYRVRIVVDPGFGTHLTGVTTFTSGGADRERHLLDIFDTVDLHHGPYSADPPYSEIEVYGLPLSPAIERAFASLGLTDFVPTADGFVAVRMDERPAVVEIDLSAVNSVGELHDKLSAALNFPGFYGRNWDAFWDAISGLVTMPRRLVVHGWRNVATRWPRDAEIMADCLREFSEQQSPPAFEYELRP